MNICILFILFNGMSYVTPACYTTGPMLEPHDVVYVQHLPYDYVEVVYESPRYYYNHYRRYRRHITSWRNYRYSPQHRSRYVRHRRHYRRHSHHVYHWRNTYRNRVHRHRSHARPRHHAYRSRRGHARPRAKHNNRRPRYKNKHHNRRNRRRQIKKFVEAFCSKRFITKKFSMLRL